MSNVTAVRLASRYLNSRSPISIGATGRLKRFVWFSGILCAVLGVTIAYIGHNQHGRHVVIHDVDVAFELTCAPPEPSFRAVDQLVPLKFEEGSKPAALADKQNNINKSNPDQTTKVAVAPIKPAVIPEAPIAVITPIIPSSPATNNPMANALANPFGGAAANAASPAAAAVAAPAGGAADGVPGGTGAGGSGMGLGHGDANSLAGGDFGANQPISMRAAPVAMGNIGPYKRDLVARIKQAWHPDESYDQVVVEIAVDREGKLLDTRLLESNGNDQFDSQLLKAISGTQFAALPEWYRGSHLKIKLVLKNT